MWMYRMLRSFLRLVTSVFFRNIEIVGRENIPTDGAVIFAGNHPNSLMDPVLVIAHSGRIVHFAAKDVLFRSRLLRFFLKNLGAVPIQRRKDHDGPIDNSATFAALYQVLESGRAMGIFPEGISHMESQLSRLKTGTARIALDWFAQHEGKLPLTIVPVGLTYLHRHRFRSQVLLNFGEGIKMDETWQKSYQEKPKDTVRELTDDLDVRMRALTINAPNWDVLRLMDTARRLYKPHGVHLDLASYAELTRRLSEGYLRAESEPVMQAMKEQVEAYQTRLDALGLEDHHLRKDIPIGSLFARLLGRVLSTLLLLPFAIPGMLLHAPVMMTAIVAGDHLTARKDVVATTKLISAILMIPVLYLILLFLLWQISSLKAVIILAFVLPVTGFATIRLLEQQVALWRSTRGLWRWMRLRRELQELRNWREELSTAMDQVVDRFHDPSIPRMFEKESNRKP